MGLHYLLRPTWPYIYNFYGTYTVPVVANIWAAIGIKGYSVYADSEGFIPRLHHIPLILMHLYSEKWRA